MDVARATIFVTLAGSHAHGTATQDSDIDLRGVCIAPLATRVSYGRTFEQFEGPPDAAFLAMVESRLRVHPTAQLTLGGKIESVVFDVAKFVRLGAESNPNVLELLFADERDWVYSKDLWKILHDNRSRFLSRKARQTYLGYGLAQLKRIRTHRSWLLNPPHAKPERIGFGLPPESTLSHDDRNRIDQAVAEKLRSLTSEETLEEDTYRLASHALGLPAGLIDTLAAERRYRAALKHWDAYQRWKEERNPKRAELEARFRYDTKHAMHLVRLMRSGLELLQSGNLQVRRPDFAELIAIRNGALSYEQLLAEAERLQSAMEASLDSSPLPEDVDEAALEALLLELVEKVL